jgi:MarR family transcriptional regulator, organic hydroperoxide resistance regulator
MTAVPIAKRTPRAAVPASKLDHQLCFALYTASGACIKRYSDRLRGLGLTFPQFLVLSVLWETNRVSLSQIGRRLRLDSGTLTPLLKRLAAHGLITKTPNAADKREIEVALTPAGLAMKDKVQAVSDAILSEFPFSANELESLASELGTFVTRLDGT